MKILIAEDEDLIREDLVELVHEAVEECNITQAKSAREAIELLKVENFDLILSDYNMQPGTGGELYQSSRQQNPDRPIMLITSEDLVRHEEFKNFYTDHPSNSHLPKPYDHEELLNKIKMAATASAEASSAAKEEFVPIHINNLLVLGVVTVDIFLKLSREKYVKVVSSGGESMQDIFLKYKKKGIQFLYLKRKDYGALILEIADYYQKKLQSIDGESFEQAKAHIANSYIFIHNNLEELGISTMTRELVDKSVKAQLGAIKKVSSIKDLLGGVDFVTDISFLHAYLTTYIGGHIFEHLGWNGPEFTEKLSQASFIHDMTVKSDNLILINSMNDPLFKKLPIKEKQKYLEHPLEEAKIVNQYTNFSSDTETIITQHHELPDGSGFPYGIKANKISPLAAVFIISHNLSHIIIDPRMSSAQRAIEIEYLEELYCVSPFDRPYQIVKETLNWDILEEGPQA